jgi:hypothetical protein
MSVPLIPPRSILPFTKAHWQSLAFFATALASGKRPYEALLVKRILDGELMVDIASIKAEVQKRYGYEPSDRSVEGACNVLSDQFFKEQDRTKFGNIRYLQRQGAMVRPTTQFLDLLSEPMYRSCVSDVVAFSLAQFAKKDLHLVGKVTSYCMSGTPVRMRAVCWDGGKILLPPSMVI